MITKPADLKEGIWYKVRVVASSNQYEWFINNQPMWKFQDGSPQFAYGAIGLYTRNVEASFDDVIVKGDITMDMTHGATFVLSRAKLITLWGDLKSKYRN